MILLIDVSDFQKVKLTLSDPTRKQHIFGTNHNLSERLLPEIKKFLSKNKKSLKQLSEIKIQPGPGFSRTRTAAAVANALAFGLNLPQKVINPVYDKAPNITQSKKVRL